MIRRRVDDIGFQLKSADVDMITLQPREAGTTLISCQAKAQRVRRADISQHTIITRIDRLTAGQQRVRQRWSTVISQRARVSGWSRHSRRVELITRRR